MPGDSTCDNTALAGSNTTAQATQNPVFLLFLLVCVCGFSAVGRKDRKSTAAGTQVITPYK